MESYATAQQVYAAGLVFARLGAIVMLIQGIGETFIPPRIRLAFAMSLATDGFSAIIKALPMLMVKSYTFWEVKQISCKRGEIVQKAARCQIFVKIA